jgi:hypothetical protein
MKISNNKITRILSAVILTTGLFAADSEGITGTITTLSGDASLQNIVLQKGWNLLGINANLTLTELKNQLGDNNLLVISKDEPLYRIDDPDSAGNFTQTHEKEGYWIKIAHESELKYTPKNYTDKTIPLHAGWNLINPLSELTLFQIQNQLGNQNIEVIQGAGKIYKKKNPDFLNDFTMFEEPYGYWIKITEDRELHF